VGPVWRGGDEGEAKPESTASVGGFCPAELFK